MFDRIGRSWELVREAWAVLRQDRELVIFPILSGIFSFIAVLGFLLPVGLTAYRSVNEAGPRGARLGAGLDFDPWHYLVVFAFYLVTYFIVVFFNSGLVACVRIRLQGGDPSVKDGMDFAFGNVGRIFLWALFSATVGTMLRAIEEHVNWLGQIVVSLIGLAWSLATMFVVPVLVHERVGPFDALKRSADVFRRTWGETVVANFGIGLGFTLLALAPVLLLVAAGAACGFLASSGQVVAGAICFGTTLLVCVVYWIALSIVQAALQGIFLTACYQYATTGEVPSAFSRSFIVDAWQPRKK
jgi:hypothetical protein